MQAAPIALLYPGDRAMRDRSDPNESRFAGLFQAFAAEGVGAMPAVYHDDFADEVEAQLRDARLVLVWCNPIEAGRRRDRLDAMLRRLAARGIIVSAHPDAILKLGTKDVLFESHHLPFGSDVHRVGSLEQLEAELPGRLAHGPRVLKQHRGQSGNGVWRIEAVDARPPWTALRVRHAQRGSSEQAMTPAELRATLAPYFQPENGGHMIDQAWQPRLAEGMVRAYLVGDRVAGFGCQAVNALFPAAPGQAAPQPGPRLYHDAELAQYQGLRQRLESEWIALLASCVGLPRDQLPLLWDCDFLLGERAPGSEERYVLCEINVSSVSPFPPSAIRPIVAEARSRLAASCFPSQLPLHPRTYLFVPATRPERFGKALASGADAVILDLEDAVAPDDKPSARQAVVDWFAQAAPAEKSRVVVRINDANSAWFADDLLALRDAGASFVLLPKAESGEQVAATQAALRTAGVLALVESARGVADVEAIAAAGVSRLVFGNLDFALDLDIDITTDSSGLAYAASRIAIASRVAGLPPPVAGVTPQLDDLVRLQADLAIARGLGFGAKLCIHPRQVEPIHAALRPSAEALEWARRVLAADAQSPGAARLDGRMIDRPVVLQAQRTLSLARD